MKGEEMKTIRLVFGRIFTYFSENKLIFILYTLGSIVCIFMMIYYYGNILSYKNGSTDDNISFRIYRADFTVPVNMTKSSLDKLHDFEQEYGIQDISLISVISADGEDDMDFTETHPAFYLNFSDSQKTMIIETSLNEDTKGRNEDIIVKGNKLQAVKNSDSYCISAEKYFALGLRTCRIRICLSQKFSKNMMFRYGDFLNQVFREMYPESDIEVKTPANFYGIEDSDIMKDFTLIMAVFVVSMISFMFLLKYIMDSARYENSVFMMVGASKKHILLMNALENIVITTFCTVLAIIFHISLYQSIFSKVNMYENIIYNFDDYIIIFFMSIGLSFLIQIPFIFVYWSNNIRKIKEG